MVSADTGWGGVEEPPPGAGAGRLPCADPQPAPAAVTFDFADVAGAHDWVCAPPLPWVDRRCEGLCTQPFPHRAAPIGLGSQGRISRLLTGLGFTPAGGVLALNGTGYIEGVPDEVQAARAAVQHVTRAAYEYVLAGRNLLWQLRSGAGSSWWEGRHADRVDETATALLQTVTSLGWVPPEDFVLVPVWRHPMNYWDGPLRGEPTWPAGPLRGLLDEDPFDNY